MVYLNIKSHVIKETEIFIPVVRGNYNNFHQGISQLDFFFFFVHSKLWWLTLQLIEVIFLGLGVLLSAFVLEGVLTLQSLCAEFQWKISGMSPSTHLHRPHFIVCWSVSTHWFERSGFRLGAIGWWLWPSGWTVNRKPSSLFPKLKWS